MPLIAVQMVYQRKDPFLQEADRTIRQWLSQSPRCAAVTVIDRLQRLDQAFDNAQDVLHAAPGNIALIVPLGFEDEELDSYDAVSGQDRVEVICFRRGPDPLVMPSASLLEHKRTVIGHVSLLEAALDKLRLRLRFKEQGITFRAIESDDELVQYFRLRYDVYKSLGYIPPECDASKTRWEVHWSDHWSLPFGAFTPNGELIGCARLVSELGVGNRYGISIRRMIEERRGDEDYQILRRCSDPPLWLEHPFDLLAPFAKFKDYYQVLVRHCVRKAEVSRVMRRPEWRGQRLGEVIVDSLRTIALEQQFHMLMLACMKKHCGFYGKSGFVPVPEMECDRFGCFPVETIAMWQWFVEPPEPIQRFLPELQEIGGGR